MEWYNGLACGTYKELTDGDPEAEKVEDNNDNGEAIEEGNVVAEPQQPAEAPETPAPEDEAGE